eukprot:CAMPEP_0197252730 /NCGR_PEP_ID=MMETSP1429-20130617/62463_1 /TAXON_ID=49237 /ORGANISM="Chaetoceros  sp., Strain UNC1202" /LENGTH=137 /DNA_ID=CAMNT_0042715191 /DNA_START=168 /DNA_END=581 /DNA_ORIENTATION=-
MIMMAPAPPAMGCTGETFAYGQFSADFDIAASAPSMRSTKLLISRALRATLKLASSAATVPDTESGSALGTLVTVRGLAFARTSVICTVRSSSGSIVGAPFHPAYLALLCLRVASIPGEGCFCSVLGGRRLEYGMVR